jgi:hypothetical protein
MGERENALLEKPHDSHAQKYKAHPLLDHFREKKLSTQPIRQ